MYSEEEKAKLLKKNDSITKRQIVVYQETYNHIETDDDTPTNSNISMELSRRKLNTLQTFINEDYHKD